MLICVLGLSTLSATRLSTNKGPTVFLQQVDSQTNSVNIVANADNPTRSSTISANSNKFGDSGSTASQNISVTPGFTGQGTSNVGAFTSPNGGGNSFSLINSISGNGVQGSSFSTSSSSVNYSPGTTTGSSGNSNSSQTSNNVQTTNNNQTSGTGQTTTVITQPTPAQAVISQILPATNQNSGSNTNNNSGNTNTAQNSQTNTQQTAPTSNNQANNPVNNQSNSSSNNNNAQQSQVNQPAQQTQQAQQQTPQQSLPSTQSPSGTTSGASNQPNTSQNTQSPTNANTSSQTTSTSTQGTVDTGNSKNQSQNVQPKRPITSELKRLKSDLNITLISLSPQGDLLVADSNGGIYNYNPDTQTSSLIMQIPGTCKPIRLEAAFNGNPFVVTDCGYVHYINSIGAVMQLYNCAKDMKVGRSGELYKLGCVLNNGEYDAQQLYCSLGNATYSAYSAVFVGLDNPSCRWVSLNRTGSKLFAGNNSVFVISQANNNNTLYKYDSSINQWTLASDLSVQDAAIANNGQLYVIDNTSRLHAFNPSLNNSQSILASNIQKVVAGPNNRIYLLDTSGSLYQANVFN